MDNRAKTVSVWQYIGRTVLLAGLGALLIGLGFVVGNGITGKAVFFNLVFVSVSGGLLGALIGSANFRRFVLPMKTIIQQVALIAEGDLTGKLAGQKLGAMGDLGKTLDGMVESWRNMISQLNSLAHEVAGASQGLYQVADQHNQAAMEIANLMQQVAGNTEYQTERTKAGAEAMQEVAEAVSSIADTALAVAGSSHQASKDAQLGEATIKKAVTQMGLIDQVAVETISLVKLLGERSQEIGRILEIITDIANQTNLLALNAAIEAARAGENGRGFAVVAEEVRKLAEQSEESAMMISGLVEEIQAGAGRSMEAMSSFGAEVNSGKTLVEEAGEIFVRILASSQKVAEQLQAVKGISEEVRHKAEEMALSMEKLRDLTHETGSAVQHAAATSEEQVSCVEEITSAAASLSEVAGKLEQSISVFKI